MSAKPEEWVAATSRNESEVNRVYEVETRHVNIRPVKLSEIRAQALRAKMDEQEKLDKDGKTPPWPAPQAGYDMGGAICAGGYRVPRIIGEAEGFTLGRDSEGQARRVERKGASEWFKGIHTASGKDDCAASHTRRKPRNEGSERKGSTGSV